MSLLFDTSIYPVKRYDYDINGNLIYEGFTSSQISDINDPVWIILKYIYDSVNNRVSTKIAEGEIINNKKWTDRKKYHYSSLVIIYNSKPIIDNISWDNDNHSAANSYILTVTTHDPDDTDTITYSVTCDDSNINIVQDTINNNIFTITYPKYPNNTNITYTITVTDNYGLSDNIITTKLVSKYIEDKGIFGILNTIDYIIISTLGNAQNFGILTIRRYWLAATSNSTNNRGVFGGGYRALNVIDYITISTLGNTQDFGDLTIRRQGLTATSNGTNERGIFGGGRDKHRHFENVIDYITISILCNAQDFGDLTIKRNWLAAISNNINDRGVFSGGYFNTNVIDYITISTLGNAQDFGDLTVKRQGLAATSNGTNNRGVFGGGYRTYNIIDYITISTLSNAQDFGDLTVARCWLSSTSNGTNNRGVFAGGFNLNIIDYITISTLGDAQDFGDLTIRRHGLAATSNA